MSKLFVLCFLTAFFMGGMAHADFVQDLLRRAQVVNQTMCVPPGALCQDFSSICCTDASFCSPGKFCP